MILFVLLDTPSTDMTMDLTIRDLNSCWILLVLFLVVLYQWWQQRQLPKNIPWVGNLSNPLSRHFAQYKVLLYGHGMLEESYYKVSDVASTHADGD